MWFCCCGCKYPFRGFDLPNPLQYVTHWTVDGNTASTDTAETSGLEYCALKLRGQERNNYSVSFSYSVSGVVNVHGENGLGFTIDSGTNKVWASYDGTTSGPYYAEVSGGTSGTCTIATGTGTGLLGTDVYINGSHAFSIPIMSGTVVWRLVSGSSASIEVVEDSIRGISLSEDEIEDGCVPVGILPWPAAGASSITLEVENGPRTRSDFEGPWTPPCPACDDGTYTLYPAVTTGFPIPCNGLWLSDPFPDYASNCGLYRIYFAEYPVTTGWAGIRIEAGAVRYFVGGDPSTDRSNWTVDGWFEAFPDELVGLGLSAVELARGGTSRTGSGGLLIGGSTFCFPVSCTATPNY